MRKKSAVIFVLIGSSVLLHVVADVHIDLDAIGQLKGWIA